MRAVLRYLKQHPWQRRAVTACVAAIAGVALAWVAWPTYRDWQILKLLSSAEASQRQRGIDWAVEVARREPQFARRLAGRLASEGDLKFAGIAEVLNRLGLFNAAHVPPEQIDRWRAVNIAAAQGRADSAELRRLMLHALILDGRDNGEVRRGLALAAGDAEEDIRAASAVLAARLGEDGTLEKLLSDVSAQVRSAAAIDAALAGRGACLAKIAGIFEHPATDDDLSSAAYALARLAPDRFAAPIAERAVLAAGADNEELLGRMLYVAAVLGHARAGGAVEKVLALARQAKQFPPPMAFVAAGRMGLASAEGEIRRAIEESLRLGTKLTLADVESLAGAIHAARRLKLPVADQVARVMGALWQERTTMAMILSAELLGDGPLVMGKAFLHEGRLVLATTIPARGPLAENEIAEILRRAATRPGTPVPSVAAAVALFKIAPHVATEGLRLACESEQWLAGDYLAWHLARDQRQQQNAWHIAREFFRPEMYDKGAWSAAAVLMAQLLRGHPEAQGLAASLEERISRERDPFLIGSYQCALLILDHRKYAGAVAELARSDAFPKRRALTALVLAGEPEGLDMVFAAEPFDPGRMDAYLTGRLMAQVYSAVAPELPEVDVDASQAVRFWQCRIARDFYLIHRRAVLDRMRK